MFVVKILGILATGYSGDAVFPLLKSANSFDYILWCLMIKEEASFALNNCFECTTFFVGQDRRSCCLGFEGNETKIFKLGEDDGVRLAVQES